MWGWLPLLSCAACALCWNHSNQFCTKPPYYKSIGLTAALWTHSYRQITLTFQKLWSSFRLTLRKRSPRGQLSSWSVTNLTPGWGSPWGFPGGGPLLTRGWVYFKTYELQSWAPVCSQRLKGEIWDVEIFSLLIPQSQIRFCFNMGSFSTYSVSLMLYTSIYDMLWICYGLQITWQPSMLVHTVQN